MNTMQFLQEFALSVGDDDVAELLEACGGGYDEYDYLDEAVEDYEDFDEYGELTEAFLKKSDDKQQKKANAIGNRMLKHLKNGNQKAADKEAAKLSKILKLKPIKLPAPIMNGLKKCKTGVDQASAKISNTFSKKDKKSNKSRAKNECFSNLRALAEGIETDVTVRGGFEDWNTDSCPYTGEPEEMEQFPRGGNSDEFEGSWTIKDEGCGGEYNFELSSMINESARFEDDDDDNIDEAAYASYCQTYRDALDECFDSLYESAESTYEGEQLDIILESLAHSYNQLMLEAIYSVNHDEHMLDEACSIIFSDDDDDLDEAAVARIGDGSSEPKSSSFERLRDKAKRAASSAKGAAGKAWGSAKSKASSAKARASAATKAGAAKLRAGAKNAGYKAKYAAHTAGIAATKAKQVAKNKWVTVSSNARKKYYDHKNSKSGRGDWKYNASTGTFEQRAKKSRKERRAERAADRAAKKSAKEAAKKKGTYTYNAQTGSFVYNEETFDDPALMSNFLDDTFD